MELGSTRGSVPVVESIISDTVDVVDVVGEKQLRIFL